MTDFSRNPVAADGNALDEVMALRALHQELEQRLSILDAHVYLTPEEQVERKQIQKKKLRLKDRMQILQTRRS